MATAILQDKERALKSILCYVTVVGSRYLSIPLTLLHFSSATLGKYSIPSLPSDSHPWLSLDGKCAADVDKLLLEVQMLEFFFLTCYSKCFEFHAGWCEFNQISVEIFLNPRLTIIPSFPVIFVVQFFRKWKIIAESENFKAQFFRLFTKKFLEKLSKVI